VRRRARRALEYAAPLIAGALLVGGCGGGAAKVALSGAQPPAATLSATIAGKPFTDPQGTYTIQIGSDWVDHTGAVAKEIELWTVANEAGGFTPNVNILTQTVPAGLSLPNYLAATENQFKGVGGDTKLVRKQILQRPDGSTLGLLEYTSSEFSVPKGKPLHFLAAVDIKGTNAVLATLTVDEARYTAVASTVEPYLKTLRAT
jgi:hypothetical protein